MVMAEWDWFCPCCIKATASEFVEGQWRCVDCMQPVRWTRTENAMACLARRAAAKKMILGYRTLRRLGFERGMN